MSSSSPNGLDSFFFLGRSWYISVVDMSLSDSSFFFFRCARSCVSVIFQFHFDVFKKYVQYLRRLLASVGYYVIDH